MFWTSRHGGIGVTPGNTTSGFQEVASVDITDFRETYGHDITPVKKCKEMLRTQQKHWVLGSDVWFIYYYAHGPGRKLDGLGRTARSHDKNRTRGAPPRPLHMTFLTVYSARFNPSEAPKKLSYLCFWRRCVGPRLKKGHIIFWANPQLWDPQVLGRTGWQTKLWDSPKVTKLEYYQGSVARLLIEMRARKAWKHQVFSRFLLPETWQMRQGNATPTYQAVAKK